MIVYSFLPPFIIIIIIIATITGDANVQRPLEKFIPKVIAY